jgi:hypothetical protein
MQNIIPAEPNRMASNNLKKYADFGLSAATKDQETPGLTGHKRQHPNVAHCNALKPVTNIKIKRTEPRSVLFKIMLQVWRIKCSVLPSR